MNMLNSPVHAFITLIALAVYLTPAIVAWTRHAPHPVWVTVINVFTGWTVLGWVGALVMACWPRPAAAPASDDQVPMPPQAV